MSVTDSGETKTGMWIWRKDRYWQEPESRGETMQKRQGGRREKCQRNHIPESLLQATDVFLIPLALGLFNQVRRDAGPLDLHLGDPVLINLVEIDREGAVVARRPVSQAPLLDDLCGLVELDVFARDIAVEDGELAANVGALKLPGHAAREEGDALRIGESLVQFLGGGPHLVRGCDSGGPDRALAGSGGGG